VASTNQITFRLTSVPREVLESAADDDQRTITSLLNKLVADYVADRELRKRLADAERGRNVTPHAEAMQAAEWTLRNS